MSDQVKVNDLEVFRQFRAALLKFAQAATQSMTTGDAEITRAHSWLTSEQATFWQGQLHRRGEAAVAARQAVIQKKVFKDPSGKSYSAVEEEKALRKCEAAVEEARQKILAVKRAIPKLEGEAQLYRGGVSRLSEVINGDIPKAVALLDRLAARLEEYVKMQAPASGGAEPSSFSAAIAHAAEMEPAPPPAPPPAVAAEAAASGPTDPKEGENVAAGK